MGVVSGMADVRAVPPRRNIAPLEEVAANTLSPETMILSRLRLVELVNFIVKILFPRKPRDPAPTKSEPMSVSLPLVGNDTSNTKPAGKTIFKVCEDAPALNWLLAPSEMMMGAFSI